MMLPIERLIMTDVISGSAESAAPVLNVQHFTKKYGSKVAVNDLTLNVLPGDIYGFIGHNGAGKTTLIKCIVGAQPFEGGEIYVDGKNVVNDPIATKQLIAYVPDNPDIYEFMSGIKYLNYVADIFGVPAQDRVERITVLANRLGITDSLANPISSFSHGMKQKLVLVSALLHEPKLLVLDEPFVGLDPAASFELKKMLHELASRGSAVFFSSHVLEVVEKLCNKIAIIREGKLLAAGETEEIRGNSSLEEVFLGMEVGAPGVTDELAADMAAAEKTAASETPTAPMNPSAPQAPSPKAPVNQEGDR
ncbi:ABC transporter ATP-binding protein [Lancefieldella rimae]|nr:ABC transporter ATP-binding protein [Lancefieldella rimae]